MKKMNFKWLVVLCMTMGFVNVAKAQIYSSEDCFYSREGSSNVEYVVKFEGIRVWLKGVSHTSTVKSNLAKSKDFYENEVWTEDHKFVFMYEYDSQRSTNVREVYKCQAYKNIYNSNCPDCRFGAFGACGKHGMKPSGNYLYVAFSKDKSSFIKWNEKKDNYDGQIQNRTDYTRVPKEDLLPKAVNDDFLH